MKSRPWRTYRAEFSVGADQGDAVGNGLGDDQAVVGVAVVVVEREGGEGVEVPFRQRLHLNAGSPYTAEDVRGGTGDFLLPILPIWQRCTISLRTLTK